MGWWGFRYSQFHKSDTPLRVWFGAILAFSSGKSGVSAKFLERELEVTYKTAWRILNRIRKALKQEKQKLTNIVEMDTAYFGGKGHGGEYNKNAKKVMAQKSVVMGAVERRGNVKVDVVENASAKTIAQFLEAHIAKEDTILMTDSAKTYQKVATGFDRHTVNHKSGEYVRGAVYVNTLESFWAHVKRSIKGTHKIVSKKHLQSYLDGFVFHYNNRYSDRERFVALLGTLLRA